MNFKDFLIEKTRAGRKVIVVYGGGFQPFHQGHMSSYEQAKSAFSQADFFVASSNDIKLRPIPFADKKFLAQQAGVKDSFVQAKSPLNPTEITDKYDPKKDILVLVRSERDPVPYKKKDGSPAYYQPFESIDKCEPFEKHGYIFVTKKKVFEVLNQEVFSGSQVRSMYTKANDQKREQIIQDLYPHSKQHKKVKTMLDKYLIVKEDLDNEFEELLIEGVHDKGIFKAVFLAGGPGSGKDYVMNNTLDGHGLTEINSDKALEYLMDKKGLDKKMPESEKEARDFVRSRAKNVTELRHKLALMGRNGLIINGTGEDMEKVKKIKKKLEELGYETSMLMVNTSDDVSASRNIERGQRGGRTVPENIRKEKWDGVQKNRAEFAKLFRGNYHEFENSEDLRTADPEVVQAKTKEMQDIFKKMREFTSRKPSSEKATDWVMSELGKKDTLPIQKPGSDGGKMAHPDEKTAEESNKLGLEYYGFGRYGKQGKVTHRSLHGKLVPVERIQRDVEKHQKMKQNISDMLKKQKTPKKVNEDINSLFEAVTISITADTPEEAAEALHLLKSEPGDYGVEEQQIQLSGSDAMRMLMLGNNSLGESKKKEKYITDENGNIRVFTLRSAAAKEAHTHNGEVVRLQKGYAVKLKEETQNVGFSNQSFLREERREEARSSSSNHTISERQATSREEGQEARKKITITEIRERQKAKIQEAIDKGIEPGLSMATSGENMSRGATKVKQLKKPLEELTGDETTMSIGDQKEDELKKKGINLSTFKAKKFIG